jgi:hypothetical protein
MTPKNRMAAGYTQTTRPRTTPTRIVRWAKPAGREIGRPTAAAALVGAFVGALAVGGAAPLAAQAPLGVPYIGDNHVSFYSTELTTDGVGTGTSALYGGRYGHQFGHAGDATRFSLLGQVAARDRQDPRGGILDASVTAAWTRHWEGVDDRLSTTAAVGMNALLWGLDEPDTGLARLSLPLTLGVAYDLRVGRATLTPFVAQGIARFNTRSYVNGVRASTREGWDGRFTAGVSLRLRALVLTTSRIRGEQGLPNPSRWAFAVGVSF